MTTETVYTVNDMEMRVIQLAAGSLARDMSEVEMQSLCRKFVWNVVHSAIDNLRESQRAAAEIVGSRHNPPAELD